MSTYDEAKLIPWSDREGWRLGLIGTPWPGPWPKKNGDLFVAAPNGAQAGLAWESRGPDLVRIADASEGRWGVFQVRFPFPVYGPEDIVTNFHVVLPLLQREYEAYCAARQGTTASSGS